MNPGSGYHGEIGMAVTFDTHKAVTRLRRKAGFDERQATAVVETVSHVLTGNLATGQDLAVLRREMTVEMASLRSEMTTEMASLRSEMTTEMASLRSEMSTEVTSLRSEMSTEVATLRGELTAVRGEMAAGLSAVRGEMTTELTGVRGEISTLRADLMAELHKHGQRMTTRLGAVAVAAVGIMVAFDKLL
jgi:transcriptional regulator of acetoin/glycerol metabolism